MTAFDLATTFIHLGRQPTATALPDFVWTQACLEEYQAAFEADGDAGRLVCITAQESTWDSWERHPAGEEVVVLLSGRVDVVWDLDGTTKITELRPGQAMINPTNVWHTARVHEPGLALFISPGRGTEHRPLD